MNIELIITANELPQHHENEFELPRDIELWKLKGSAIAIWAELWYLRNIQDQGLKVHFTYADLTAHKKMDIRTVKKALKKIELAGYLRIISGGLND